MQSVFPSSIDPPWSPFEIPQLDPQANTQYVVMPGATALVAFQRIAVLLDIACSLVDGFHVRAPPDNIPPPLKPTQHQQVVPHKTFIDVIPWPTLRDKVLASLSVINQDELLLGLRECRIWGSAPCDPMSWEIDETFARKWWFLMDETVLASTNFWRAQRGDIPLILAQLIPGSA
jgi:hypothetical protein